MCNTRLAKQLVTDRDLQLKRCGDHWRPLETISIIRMREHRAPLKNSSKTAEGFFGDIYIRVFLLLSFFFPPKEDTYKKLIHILRSLMNHKPN